MRNPLRHLTRRSRSTDTSDIMWSPAFADALKVGELLNVPPGDDGEKNGGVYRIAGIRKEAAQETEGAFGITVSTSAHVTLLLTRLSDGQVRTVRVPPDAGVQTAPHVDALPRSLDAS